MPRNLVRSRLQSLFAGFGQEIASPQPERQTTISGWTWECDAQGNYTTCSSGIETVLGVRSKDFIGQALNRAGLPEESARDLELALQAGKFPFEIQLEYQTSTGQVTPVNLHVMRREAPAENDGTFVGLRGFSQVLEQPQALPLSGLPIPADSTSDVAAPDVSDRETSMPSETGTVINGWGYLAQNDHTLPISAALTPNGLEILSPIKDIGGAHPQVEIEGIFVKQEVENAPAELLVEILSQDPRRRWSEPERLLVERVSAQLALSIENTRLHEHVKQLRKTEDLVFEACSQLTNTTTYSQVLSTLRRFTILGQENVSHISILLKPYSSADGSLPEDLAPVAQWSQATDPEPDSSQPPVSWWTLLGPLADNKTPTFVEDVPGDVRLDLEVRNILVGQLHVKSLLCIPIIVSGRSIGLLLAVFSEKPSLPEADFHHLFMLMNMVSIRVENIRLLEVSRRRGEQIPAFAALALWAVESAGKAAQQRAQFLANMSDELRTPMNSIMGFTRLLQNGLDGPLTPQQDQDLTAIYHSGQYLINLIDELTDISRLEAGKLELHLEEGVNLVDVIDKSMSTAMDLIKDKPIELRHRIAKNIPLVQVDPVRICQVLTKLLANAIKHIEQGAITLEARAQVGPAGKPEVIIEVTDPIAGRQLQIQKTCAQPCTFILYSDSTDTEYIDPELSIAYRLVEMHGGRMGADNKKRIGSTLYFTLPIQVFNGDSSSVAGRSNPPEVIKTVD